MPLTAPPPAPVLSDTPAAFDAKAYALVNWHATNVTELTALQTDVATKQGLASSAASAAATAQSLAESAQIAAAAAASFKGAWAGLAGALAMPATVSHGGLIWTLLSNLPNVATKTPGVAAEWQRVQFGVLQVVVSNYALPFSTTSTSYVDTGLTASITPKSTSSKVLAIVLINSMLASVAEGWAYLYRGATQLSSVYIYAYSGLPRVVAVLDSPASTTAQNYSLKARTVSGGTISLPRTGSIPDTLILMEVLP